MSDQLYLWSTVPGDNSEPPPLGAPENGCTIDSLNNIMREMMGTVRSYYNVPQWRNFGLTIIPVSENAFRVDDGDFTNKFFVGQRLQFLDTTLKYGTIVTVVEGASLNVTVDMDGTDALDVPTIVYAGNPKNRNEVGGDDQMVVVSDGVGNAVSSGRLISDTYNPPVDPVGDPDLTTQVPSMQALAGALRTSSGTFTPKIYTESNSGGGGVVYVVQNGSFYTFGDLVYVSVRILLSNVGNIPKTNDPLLCSGLPAGLEAYDPNNTDQTVGMLSEYNFTGNTSSGVPDGGICAMISNNSLIMRFKQPGRSSGGNMVNVNGNTCIDTTSLRFSGVYRRAPV